MRIVNTQLVLTLLVVLIAGCETRDVTTVAETQPNDPLEGKIVDLSYDFSEETVYWVNAKKFEKETVSEGDTEGGFYYSAYNIEAAEHGGTHIDAPIHFAEGKKTVDQLSLKNLIGDGVVIDVSEAVEANRDYLVTVADLEKWESANGEIAKSSIILFRTGFGKFYPDTEKYLGTAERGDDATKDLSFPGLHPDAAKWLVENRGPKAVGIDTASIDHGPSKDFRAHVELMTKDIPAFENVANLDKLPAKGFKIIALPMKIRGGSGGPLRIIALLGNG